MRFLALLVVSMGLAACGPSVIVERLGHPLRPLHPKPAEEVAVVTQKPEQPFVELALLRMFDTDEHDLLTGTFTQKVRAHGARLGCDAVIVLDPRGSSGGGVVASCIQYTAPSS